MTAAAFTPRVRLMAVCDGVRESKTEADVYNLKGVRQGIVGHDFPLASSSLWLFLVLTSPRPGEFPGYIVVVHDRTDKTVHFGKLYPRPSFEADDEFCAAIVPIRCSFPEEGRYAVQVWFFQEQGSDVLKGELPFIVAKEGI